MSYQYALPSEKKTGFNMRGPPLSTCDLVMAHDSWEIQYQGPGDDKPRIFLFVYWTGRKVRKARKARKEE
jgi:hypothetical protein